MFCKVVVLREKKSCYGFALSRKFSNDSERRAQVSTSFSLQLSQDLLYLSEKIALCRRCVVLPKELSNGLSQN